MQISKRPQYKEVRFNSTGSMASLGRGSGNAFNTTGDGEIWASSVLPVKAPRRVVAVVAVGLTETKTSELLELLELELKKSHRQATAISTNSTGR